MSEFPPLRTVCTAQIDNFFLAAVQRPFKAEDPGFEMLDFMAQEVRQLSDGSQVFVYARESFGDTPAAQETGLKEYLDEMVEQVGSIALYPTIRSLKTAK